MLKWKYTYSGLKPPIFHMRGESGSAGDESRKENTLHFTCTARQREELSKTDRSKQGAELLRACGCCGPCPCRRGPATHLLPEQHVDASPRAGPRGGASELAPLRWTRGGRQRNGDQIRRGPDRPRPWAPPRGAPPPFPLASCLVSREIAMSR